MNTRTFKRFTCSLLILVTVLTGAVSSNTHQLTPSPVYASEVAVTGRAVNLIDINGHWAEQIIRELVSQGAISGYPDGTYRPNNTISTAELTSIVAGATGVVGTPGADSHWASPIFNTLYQKQVLSQSDFPQASYNKPISRYQMIKLLIQVNENVQNIPAVDASDAHQAIRDYQSIPQAYKTYVEQAVKKGLIAGDQNKNINGSSTCTRAEAAAIIKNLKASKPGKVITIVPINPVTPPVDGQQTPVTEDLAFLKDSRIGIDYTQPESILNAKGVMSESQARVAFYYYSKDPDKTLKPIGTVTPEGWQYTLDQRAGRLLGDIQKFRDKKYDKELIKEALYSTFPQGKYITSENLFAHGTSFYTLAMEVRTQSGQKQYRVTEIDAAGKLAYEENSYRSTWHNFPSEWND